MSKINPKIDRQLLSELSGRLSKDSIDPKNKKLQSLFDIINTHEDYSIDVKEITDFTNSIFKSDKNGDGEISEQELNEYIKTNEELFKGSKIKAKDIIEFLNIFKAASDKADDKSKRITNSDGSYSIIYEDTQTETIPARPDRDAVDRTKIYFVTKQINYNQNNEVTSIETTNGNKKTITDKDGNFIAEERYENEDLIYRKEQNGEEKNYQNGQLVSEKKSDGFTYYYNGDITTIKKGNTIYRELEITDKGTITRDYKYVYGKTIITVTDESGNTSKSTRYNDSYYITVKNGGVTSVSEFSQIINNPLSSESLHTIMWNGKDVIMALAKEDDANFIETYITGVINKLLELANLIGVEANELKAIQKEITTSGFENVSIEKMNEAYSKVFVKIEQKNPEAAESNVDNQYYKSEKSYTAIVTNDMVIIHDTETNKDTKINLSRILRSFSANEKEQIVAAFRQMPAEALLDFAIEVTLNTQRVEPGSDGSHNWVTDTISLRGGSCSVETILHELGHAIDMRGRGSESNYQTYNNAKFKKLFNEEMKAFLADGNTRCTQRYVNGEYVTKNGAETYATLNAQEMFAECYCLLMLGHCDSASTITKYFPKTLEAAKEILNNTRKLSNQTRHSV